MVADPAAGDARWSRTRARARAVACLALVLSAALAACAPAGPATTPTSSVTEGAPATTGGADDVFAGLPYRMDVPADWIVMGSPSYDAAIDTGQEVAAWLRALDLDGPSAFRAYEPSTKAGMRVAINPLLEWNPSPLQEEGTVAALPGVTGEVSSDVVATGDTWKAFGYRWTESIDWGDGSPSARECVGYFVMPQFNPVNVVFCWPAGTDRRSEAEAMVSTLRVLGNQVVSLPPGETPTPSPTPFDKNASPEPVTTLHSAPELEALLPDSFDGRTVDKESHTGVDTGMTDADPLLKQFGKHAADLAMATGTTMPTADSIPFLVGVTRLDGVPAAELMAAQLEQMPDAKVSSRSLGGRAVTYVEHGAWPVWLYPSGDRLYAIGMADEALATRILEALP